MAHRTGWVGLAFAVALTAGVESHAEVTVLGFRSLEGDEALAEQLTQYVREFVERRGLDEVSEKTQTLEQMTLLADCGDDVDPRCMREIASMLGVEEIVYGFVSRMPGEGERFSFAIDVRRFSARARRDLRSASASLESTRLGTANVQIAANVLIDELWNQPTPTALIIQSNEPGAAVYVNDELVGHTGPEPLWVTDVSPGQNDVRVVKDGFEPWERVVDVARNQYRLLETPLVSMVADAQPRLARGADVGPEPVPPRDEDLGILGDWRLWTGAGLVAAGIGMAAGGIAYSLKVHNQNLANEEDERWQLYYNAYPDICQAAEEGRGDHADYIKNICDRAFTWEVLQGVLYSLGAVVGGVGIYFLVDVLMDEEYWAETAWALTPTAFLGGGGLSLSGRF